MKNKSVFLEIFGESPILKVLDFLIINEDFDYSMTDIANLSGIGYSTLKLIWPKLEKSNIIKQTRIIGKAKMYKLNNQNSIVKKFKIFYWETTKHKIHDEIKLKQTLKVKSHQKDS